MTVGLGADEEEDEGLLPAGGADGHLADPLEFPATGRDLLSSGVGEAGGPFCPWVLGGASGSLLGVEGRVPGRSSEAHLGRVAGRGPLGEGRCGGAAGGGAQARRSDDEAERWRRGRERERVAAGGTEGEADEGDLARGCAVGGRGRGGPEEPLARPGGRGGRAGSRWACDQTGDRGGRGRAFCGRDCDTVVGVGGSLNTGVLGGRGGLS